MQTHRLLAPVLASLVSLGIAAGCAGDGGGGGGGTTVIPDASLVVFNDSDYAIYEIYLTPAGDPDWGPNLLRGDVLLPDEELVLGVPCDFYDALLVDEDDVECEIHDIDLCANEATWVIRNNTCTVFEAAAKQRAEQLAVETNTTL
ncbi:MAG: hypothetical protein H0T89_16390 [Deltaproteobacteria bacterium]|nr:hypothetical protein [Deltaproteobacteria bacterium]